MGHLAGGDILWHSCIHNVMTTLDHIILHFQAHSRATYIVNSTTVCHANILTALR